MEQVAQGIDREGGSEENLRDQSQSFGVVANKTQAPRLD